MAKAREAGPVKEEAPPQPKRKKWKIIVLLAGAVVLLAGGSLVGLALWSDPEPTGPGGAEGAATPRFMLSLEPFLVNLADPEARRYLKLKVELQVDTEAGLTDLKKALPVVRDALILLLSSKTYPEVSTMEGKLKLKKDILAQLKTIPGGGQISGVYFTEFVCQ